jgi:uncharacterized membrane protein
MSRLFLGLSLALAGSLALNASYLVQHVASAGAAAIDARHPLKTLRSLLSSRLWLAGGVLGATGWALSVAALTQAPLSLVQAFLVGGIALVAPIAVHALGHRLTAREFTGITLVILALLALTAGRGRVGIHSLFHGDVLGIYLILALAASGSLLLFERRRAQMLAAAGGILYGAADVGIKALTGVAGRHGVIAALKSPWLIAVAVISIGAFFCFQRALQSGKAIPVIALMTAGTNLVSIIGGLTVFQDPLGHRPATVLVHLMAFVLVVGAAWLLAPAQAAVAAPDEPANARIARQPTPRSALGENATTAR